MKFGHQVKDFKAYNPHQSMVFGLKTVEHLIGTSDECTNLQSAAFNIEEKVLEYTQANNGICLALLQTFRAFSGVHRGDYAAVMAVRKENDEIDIEKKVPVAFPAIMAHCCNAMAAIGMYHERGQVKYLRISRKIAKKISGWVKSGVSTSGTVIIS